MCKSTGSFQGLKFEYFSSGGYHFAINLVMMTYPEQQIEVLKLHTPNVCSVYSARKWATICVLHVYNVCYEINIPLSQSTCFRIFSGVK